VIIEPAPAGAGSMITIQKGLVQLTLRIYRTKIKPSRAPWYALELKNVGMEALRVDARGFSLEILDPNGNILEAQVGGERRRPEWEALSADEDSSPEELPETADSNHQFWLGPGFSTVTVAWSDRGPGRRSLLHKDDEIPRDTGHTELRRYAFVTPGTYSVRAVYEYASVDIQTGYAKFKVLE